MIVEQITSKVVCFGSNGVLVFIGVHIGVATQLKSKVAPFWTVVVVTLALGSQPKQGLAKVWVEREARELHFMLLEV
jgi:hypothetical protein